MVAVQKRELRQQLRQRRDALPASRRAADAVQVANLILDWLARDKVSHMGIYAAIGSEVPTRPLADTLLQQGARLAWPRVVDKELMEFCWAAPDELVPGIYGVPAPTPDAPIVGDGELELVFVPGVGFDRAGHRLGYGAGYYDRCLGGLRAKRIGVAYEFQLLDHVPADKHDVRMDAIVTERGITSCETTI